MSSGKDQDFLEFVLDQLGPAPGIVSRRMFGAIGLYQGTTFFAIIDDGTLYFATDGETRASYQARGMKPFEYAPGKFLRTYYPVPADILEDDAALRSWAREAVAAQNKRGTKKAARKRAAPPQKRGSR